MTAVLTAPQIERYAKIFSDQRSDWEYGQNVREYLKKIRCAVKQFQQGDDENVRLYFSAERGRIEDWDDFEERKPRKL